jgi:hypothetical protein
LQRRFTVNNINVGLPFRDQNGVTAQVNGNFLTLRTRFGLTVQFDGIWTVNIYLCDSYAGRVCGLCGNADGNRNNDFVDRQGLPVPIRGDYFTRYYQWGSKWITGVDKTIDLDGRV